MQRFRDFEHVIVDGKSSDATLPYLKGLGDTARWISEPDDGIADALNKGLAAAWATQDRVECQRLVSQGARIGFIVAVPAVVMLAIFSESVLSWFGSEYTAGARALNILLIGAFVNAALGPCRIALNVCGQQWLVLAGVAPTVIVIISVGLITIPSIGASGAAAAASISMVFWNVLFAAQCWRKLRLNTLALSKEAWKT